MMVIQTGLRYGAETRASWTVFGGGAPRCKAQAGLFNSSFGQRIDAIDSRGTDLSGAGQSPVRSRTTTDLTCTAIAV